MNSIEVGFWVVASLVALDRRRLHEYRRDMPDGSILEVRSAPTAEGGFVITQTDITALAQAEAAARERANLLQAMLDNMRHGIVVFGADHRVLAANDLCSTLGGMAPGTVRPGRGLPDLVTSGLATAYDASSHIFSRTNETTIPSISSSRSATQQPPGSVPTRWRTRLVQIAPRSGGRSWGSGHERRNIRVSSSWKPTAVTRSAAGASSTVMGRMRTSLTGPT